MTNTCLLAHAVIFGMLLAATVGQFGFPGLGSLGGRPSFGGGPFLVQRGGGGRYGGGLAGLGGLGRLGGQGGFGGRGGFGGLSGFQPPPTTTEAPPPQDPKKLAGMIVEVISRNYEYHLNHDKHAKDENSTAPVPKKVNRIQAIKQAILKHNLQQ